MGRMPSSNKLKKTVKMIYTAVIGLPLVLLATIFITGYFLAAPSYTGPRSDHFDGKRFINPEGVKAKGLGHVMRWFITRKPGEWIEKNNGSFGMKPVESVIQGARITFVNHSTFLIQVGGMNILTDPVWSERVSPFTWAGPKRMRPPGIRFDDLPQIDLVLISHNHYDHLDIVTMKKIMDGHAPKIITPLGVKEFLKEEDIDGATDLDWWDECDLNDSLSVQAVPAQHFSGRGGVGDRDATLWCGYVIKTNEGNIYFAGDTGYNDKTFKEIGERVSPVKIALIPIGSYKPQWFMSPIHVSPEEAVRIHLDVKAEKSIAIHFGTFPLGDDGQHEAVNDLHKARQMHDIQNDQFIVLQEGTYYDSRDIIEVR